MILVSELLKTFDISSELLSGSQEPEINLIYPQDGEPALCAGDICIYYSAERFCVKFGDGGTGKVPMVVLVVDTKARYEQQVKDIIKRLSKTVLYYVPDSDDPETFFFELQGQLSSERLRAEQLLTVEYRALVGLLSRGADVAELESYAYKLLGNPMIITDESTKLLAYTRAAQIDDPIGQKIISTQYKSLGIDEKSVVAYMEQFNQSSLPIFIEGSVFDGLIRRVVAKIQVGSKLKGFIALLEAEKPITRLDLYILQMLAEVIGAKLNEIDSIRHATGQLRNEFTSDLLVGNITSEEMIKGRALALRIGFGDWTCVLGIHSKHDAIYTGSELEGLRKILRNYCDLCLYTFSSGYGYFILSFSSIKKLEHLIGKVLESLLCEQKLNGVLSTPTQNLAELHLCYEQVQRLQRLFPKLSKERQALYMYSALSPLPLISMVSNDIPELMISEAYQSLLDSDKHEGTEYIATLRSFFAHNHSVTDTAKYLYIHRNTVNYRLNRIRERLKDDFNDPLVRLNLQLCILASDLS